MIDVFSMNWVISWLLAIWIPEFRVQFFLTGLFCLILTIIMSSNVKAYYEGEENE